MVWFFISTPFLSESGAFGFLSTSRSWAFELSPLQTPIALNPHLLAVRCWILTPPLRGDEVSVRACEAGRIDFVGCVWSQCVARESAWISAVSIPLFSSFGAMRSIEPGTQGVTKRSAPGFRVLADASPGMTKKIGPRTSSSAYAATPRSVRCKTQSALSRAHADGDVRGPCCGRGRPRSI